MDKTDTLKLCVDTKCIILQLFFIDYVPQSAQGFPCTNISDVRDETLKRWPYMFYGKPGLKDVANRVVGLDMPEPEHVFQSNLESRVLDDMQIEYASIDVYASFYIDHKLLKEMQ